jgi:hypothetical protein
VNEWTPIIVAFLTAASGSLMGWAALRKSRSEASKTDAEAAGAIVGAAGDVVELLRQQMSEAATREVHRDARILQLEIAVGAWEGWAERVLSILDRAMGLLGDEHAKSLAEDVKYVKRTRPARHRIGAAEDQA